VPRSRELSKRDVAAVLTKAFAPRLVLLVVYPSQSGTGSVNQTPWWIAIAIGLFSGGIGATLTYSFNYRKERSQFLREKAEELYISLDAFGRWVAARYISYKISPGAQQPLNGDDVKDAILNYRKTFALCEIYFPHIMPHLNSILHARDNLDSAMIKIEAGAQPDGSVDLRAGEFEELVKTAKLNISNQCRHPLTSITYVKLLSSPWN
jgi:hypothetical protein